MRQRGSSAGAAGRRLRSEEQGFAMVSAIAIMVIVLLVTAVGAVAVVRSFDETRRDRSSTTALSAADAALDIVTWRMNKQLVANELLYPGGYTSTILGPLGCADVSGSGIVQVQISGSTPTTCTLTVKPGDGASATCSSTLAVAVTTTNVNTLAELARNIVCTSTLNGVSRRLYARASLSLNHPSTGLANPTSIWKRTSWEECSANAAIPCPSP